MRHHSANRKFGRTKNQRNALLRSLATSLIVNEKIKTTEAKAKEIRPVVEKIITAGKKNTLASRRLLESRLSSKSASKKVVEVLSPKYLDRNGGYLRVVKLPRRSSDASPMAYVEFV